MYVYLLGVWSCAAQNELVAALRTCTRHRCNGVPKITETKQWLRDCQHKSTYKTLLVGDSWSHILLKPQKNTEWILQKQSSSLFCERGRWPEQNFAIDMFPYPWKPSPHCKNKYKGKSELEHLLVVHYQKPSFYNHNLINRQCCRAYYLIPPNLPFCRELGLSDKPHVNSLHGTLEGCPLKTCDIVGTRNCWVL